MNTQEKQKRLEEILKNNFKHEPIGIAIAITGSWGVGKTYFWNSFLEKDGVKSASIKKRRFLIGNMLMSHYLV